MRMTLTRGRTRRLRSPFVDVERLLSEDRQRVWHPYAPMPALEPPLPIVAAEGCGCAWPTGESWSTACRRGGRPSTATAHPVLDAAVRDQLGADEPRDVRRAHPRARGRPGPHAGRDHPGRAASTCSSPTRARCRSRSRSRCACSTGGRAGRPGKRRLLTWRGGYHGDTFGAMSVCDPDGGMHALWRGVLPRQVFAERAARSTFDAGLRRASLADAGRGARRRAGRGDRRAGRAGRGRDALPRPALPARAAGAAPTHDVLLIFDEIATGFGRTGALFAADHAGVAPDVMCVGKALTGGYLTLAAALCTPEVARGIAAARRRVLAHGPTFMGNPLACAVAGASIELLLARDWRGEVRGSRRGCGPGWRPRAALPGGGRRAGARRDRRRAARPPGGHGGGHRGRGRRGVWLRPFRDLVYTMPPYVSTTTTWRRSRPRCAPRAAAR